MRRSVLRAAVVTTALALSLAGVGALPAVAASPRAATGAPTMPASGQGRSYFVDCSGSAAGADGGHAHPFTTLAEVNALVLKPGDEVLFDRATTCTGTLQPQGSGDARHPVLIGAYGRGVAPTLDGGGAHDVVLLQNIDHITVQDLAITDPENPGTERNGVRIALDDFGEASGYVLQRLDIHDVMGADDKGLTGSAGIQVGITGTTTPTWISGLQIRDNTISDVDREGIYFKSTWNERPEIGTQDTSGLGPWTPSTGVVISGNTLTSIGGDGIKVDTTQGAVVAHNTLAGFDMRSSSNNAGIWPFNADNTLVEYNDVSGGANDNDGMAFDADGGAQDTIFQYNYSHDNAGGFLMMCPYSGAWTWGTIARYNVSYNDGARVVRLCPGNIQKSQVYDNTIVDETASPTYFLEDDGSLDRGVSFSDDIVVDRSTPMSVQVRGAGLEFDHDLMIGVTGVPANADGTTNPGGLSSDPGFVDEAHEPTGLNDLNGLMLRQFSPALGAGTAVADNGGRDVLGFPVPRSSAVNMGAFQEPGQHPADPAVIRMQPVSAVAGMPVVVDATLTYWGAQPTDGATATLAVSSGWTVTAVDDTVPDGLSKGATAELSWKVTPPSHATTGTATLTASVSSWHRRLGTTTTTVQVSPLYANIEAAFDNVAITADGATPYTGDLALSRSSLSSEDLQKVFGIAPGATVHGANVTYTWPQFTPGQDDAVWAQGQNIATDGQGGYLGFVLFGVNATPPVTGTASVTYTDGTTSSFTLAAGDYYYCNPGTGNTILGRMTYRNSPTGIQDGTFCLYESEVPIDSAKQVAYVTLPNLPAYADGKTPGMLVMAVGIGG